MPLPSAGGCPAAAANPKWDAMTEPSPALVDALRCLGCRTTDRLVRVEAVVQQQRTATVIRGRVPGPFGSPMPLRARTVHTTRLAVALAPPRRPRSITGPTIVLGVAGLATAVNLLAAVGSGDGSAIAGVIIMGSLAAGAARVLHIRRAAAAAWPRGRRATWLWRRCWYCQRCGTVSLLTPALTAALPATGLAAYLLAVAAQMDPARP
jgi:hypothetical protein